MERINTAGVMRCCLATFDRLYGEKELLGRDEFKCDYCDDVMKRDPDEPNVWIGEAVQARK